MRTYAQAIAFAEYQRVNGISGWSNQCQRFARSCVGADAWAASARQAFNNIPPAHRHTSFPPPPGALVYYGTASAGNGHATFASNTPGLVYSTDIKRPGKVDLVPWNVFSSAWGLTYRGWIDWTPSGIIDVRKPGVVVPAKAHVIIPTISLKKVQRAAARDPKVYGAKTYPAETLIVEKALNRAGVLGPGAVDGAYTKLTLDAYSAWQRHLGYSGKDASGVPGAKSLASLGAKYGFRVAP